MKQTIKRILNRMPIYKSDWFKVADRDYIYRPDVERLIDQIAKGQLGVIAESEGKQCPNCNNEGWYIMTNSNGEPEQIQCQFCYEEQGSKFRVLNTPIITEIEIIDD